MHLLFQLCPVLCDNLRGTLFHICHLFLKDSQLFQDILLQVLAFRRPSLNELCESPFKSFLQPVPQLCLILCLFLHRKYFGIAGQRGDADVILQAKLFFHLL